ncbi:hypothetical protein WICPIJ_009893 [Wickerhamomyces pijperi]|uniref:Uncharacterized protein n=1 Tax=Wickerhamomyces pijperi TaxID=599730 RepID=A0A9P8TC66_WICPI|nr:hypothetical protein WICPIJ_009893 [Wickerhamomyces pijperi]
MIGEDLLKVGYALEESDSQTVKDWKLWNNTNSTNDQIDDKRLQIVVTVVCGTEEQPNWNTNEELLTWSVEITRI